MAHEFIKLEGGEWVKRIVYSEEEESEDLMTKDEYKEYLKRILA